MLGIKLKPDEEQMLERYARDVKRPKSTIAREWIIERLLRESIDEQMRRAAQVIAAHTTAAELAQLNVQTDEWLRALDEEDGGYEWGPDGPPPAR